MKNILLVAIIVAVVCIIGYIQWKTTYSDESRTGQQNLKNLRMVRIGMDTNAVIKIMGRPIARRQEKKQTYFDYDAPPGWSLQCQIVFDSSGMVNYISSTE